MGIPFMTEIGLAYVEMVVNCEEIAVKFVENGDWYEDSRCIAKTVKAECASYGLPIPTATHHTPCILTTPAAEINPLFLPLLKVLKQTSGKRG